jgi:ATP-dependent protease ClpP protease subunit
MAVALHLAGESRTWYRFVAQADPTVAEIVIFDEIGASFWSEGITAKQFVADLAALPDVVTTLRVRVNSPGGDVFDAVAIANALRSQSRDKKRTVEMSIEGLAASAATIITSAGDSIKIADNAMMMIHDPIAITWGPAAEMRKMADVLDQVRGAIIVTYRWVSQLSAEALGELMAATTWMSAEEALKNGFATEIVSGVKVEAQFRPDALRRLGEIPAAYRERIAALGAEPAPAEPGPAASVTGPEEVVRLCGAAGFPQLAASLLELPVATVQARLIQAKQIRVFCEAAKQPEFTDLFIRGGVSVDAAKEMLTIFTGKLDKVEIDAGLAPGQGAAGPKPQIDTAALYAARNARPVGAER